MPLVSQATQLELGGGVTGRINANVSVFANVDYEFAVGAAEDKDETAFEARSAPDTRGEAYSLSCFTQTPKVTPIGALLQYRAAGMRA